MNAIDSLGIATGLVRAHRAQWRSAQAIRRRQERRLLEQLAFARAEVPHYRDLPVLAGLDDLPRIPVLRRAQIQARPAAFLAGGGQGGGWHYSHTSGSLGQPLETWFDPDTWRLVKYTLKLQRLLDWGWRPLDRLVIVDIDDVPEARQADHAKGENLFGESLLGARRYFSLRDAPASHIDAYRRLKPHHIYGPPSYFAELARAWDGDLRREIPLRTIMTSSEVLTDAARQQLVDVFGARVLDVYGSTEFKEIAWQCPQGSGYHVNHDSVLVELLAADGRPAADGELGELVVTSLTNRAMPLIRYGTEDYARRLGGTCPCGRAGLRLEGFEGRAVDHVPIPGLGNISPYTLTTALSHFDDVLKYKVVQQEDRSFDISLVLRKDAAPSLLDNVRDEFGAIFGHRVPVGVREVSSLQMQNVRKHRPVEVLRPGA